MLKKVLGIIAIGASSTLFSQTTANLKSQLAYCKSESNKFETDLAKYKDLLEIQGGQITELKLKIQDQENQIKNLTDENKELKNAALSLLQLGIDFEEEGKYKEAIEIYKLLIRSYPSSIQAVSSKLNIKSILDKRTSEK